MPCWPALHVDESPVYLAVDTGVGAILVVAFTCEVTWIEPPGGGNGAESASLAGPTSCKPFSYRGTIDPGKVTKLLD
jgi:hypothetical protein